MNFRKVTPVLVVERIEPCLPFWEALGFERTVEVPHEGALGFVILLLDGVEVMYQTVASVKADVPNAARASTAMLYISVDSLEPIVGKLGNAEVVHARRKSFYGADEIFVREPGGNVVGFAALPPA